MFNNPDWERLWLFLKYLIPKIKIQAEDEEDNVLEAVDMDSYRVSKQQSAKIDLASETASIYPIPVSEGGSLTEKLFESLEAIIAEFNKRHVDIEWTDRDKVNRILFRDIPEQLQDDQETLATLHNSDKQNAKILIDKKIFDVIQNLMFSHTELYKKFVGDADFKHRYQDFIFDMLWQQVQQPPMMAWSSVS